jgi:hypothetical protein
MQPPVIAASITALVAILTAGITYYLSRRREQEIEWQKLKLEYYKAYLAALSGVVSSRSTPENQIRYADAANNLQLVAPDRVLSALYNFQDEIRYDNREQTVVSHNKALTGLLRIMREDIRPSLKNKRELQFRLFAIPPEKE